MLIFSCLGLICFMSAKHTIYVLLVLSAFTVSSYDLRFLPTHKIFSVISKNIKIEFFGTGVNIIDIQ